jgi:peptidoglycan/LPS O-acetylase OafA/YrhL
MAPKLASQPRIHALDAVRGFALLLGVVLHASMSFLPGPQVWVSVDSSRSDLASVGFYVVHMFRMVLFFILAGFFARMGVQRLGAGGFARDRLKRIALPLAVFWPITLTTVTAVLVWNVWLANGGRFPEGNSPSPALSLDHFPLAHLWFLYVLILLYVVSLAARWTVGRVGARALLNRTADAFLRFAVGWGGIVLVIVPTTVALVLHPNWLMWFGVPTPDMSLKPNLAALVAYGTAFAFGWALQRQAANLLPLLERRAWHYLALAVACTVSSLVVVGSAAPVLTPALQNTTTLLYAALYSLGAWSWSLALTGLALRFLSGYSPTRRYIADAAYWVYLVHLPVVMAFQTLATRVEWSWMLEWPLVVVATLLVAFGTYRVFVRYTVIGAVLNGRRAQRVPRGGDLLESVRS